VITLLGEPFGRSLGCINEDAGVGNKKAVRVKKPAGKCVDVHASCVVRDWLRPWRWLNTRKIAIETDPVPKGRIAL
jgi:hypothetical protein